MTTQEILLTVLVIAVSILIVMTIAVLIAVYRLVRIFQHTIEHIQTGAKRASIFMHAISPISILRTIIKK